VRIRSRGTRKIQETEGPINVSVNKHTISDCGNINPQASSKSWPIIVCTYTEEVDETGEDSRPWVEWRFKGTGLKVIRSPKRC
jgi:hypothetical protein